MPELLLGYLRIFDRSRFQYCSITDSGAPQGATSLKSSGIGVLPGIWAGHYVAEQATSKANSLLFVLTVLVSSRFAVALRSRLA
jgi:hypothetical protein